MDRTPTPITQIVCKWHQRVPLYPQSIPLNLFEHFLYAVEKITTVLSEGRSYDVGIEKAIPTGLSPFEICVAMLSAHVAIGLFVTYVGAHRHRWE